MDQTQEAALGYLAYNIIMDIFKLKNDKKNIQYLLTAGGFAPLTNFPAFTNYAASTSLVPFVNSLYTYAIGIAVILAVLEIVWGGFLWMGSGASITNKEAGRHKIMMAIFGLILVLSPYIVFKFINPSALSMKLGTSDIMIKQPVAKPTPPTTKSLCKEYTSSASFYESLKVSGGCSSKEVKKLLSTYIYTCKSVSTDPNLACIYTTNIFSSGS